MLISYCFNTSSCFINSFQQFLICAMLRPADFFILLYIHILNASGDLMSFFLSVHASSPCSTQSCTQWNGHYPFFRCLTNPFLRSSPLFFYFFHYNILHHLLSHFQIFEFLCLVQNNSFQHDLPLPFFFL